VDDFVVDLRTRAIVYSPTTKFRELQGHNQAYFYNEGLQPLYSKGTNRLTGFVLITHRHLTATDSSSEIWQIKPDGTPVKRLIPEDVGAHGCSVSPNQQYLACERLNGDEFKKKGLLLTKFDGTHVGDIKWGTTVVPFGAAIWSSDSAGFVFYACSAGCQTDGFLIYYDIAKNTFTPLAPDFVPAWFCTQRDMCRPSGGHGSEIPARSPRPGEFYYSVLIGSTNGEKPRRVLGSVSLANPNVFHPLTFEEFTEPAQPVVSADNRTVAFIANFSITDTIAALYSVDVRTRSIHRLSKQGDNFYAPQWQDWLSVSNGTAGASGNDVQRSR
jgi:hypothetical protein